MLRLQPGDKAVLFNGRGREMTAEITSLDAAQVQLRKLHEAETPPLRCRITLAQAIPKGKNMDLIVQKAVEIGAAEIAPLLSDRTVVDLDEGGSAKAGEMADRRDRSRQAMRTELAAAGAHAAHARSVFSGLGCRGGRHNRWICGRGLPRLRLIGSLQSDAVHLKKILAEYSNEHHERPTSVLIVIGPEGDFTPAELSLARSHGCRPITLGPIILRVETASIYCLSVLSYELLA